MGVEKKNEEKWLWKVDVDGRWLFEMSMLSVSFLRELQIVASVPAQK
jgi:hypothetical protein